MGSTKRKISEVEDVETQPIPSVKGLASSEARVRRVNFEEVIQHLESRPSSSPLTSTQCLQLWRGFHVALYMHDSKNLISVQNLTQQIADSFGIVRMKDQEVEEKAPASAGREDNYDVAKDQSERGPDENDDEFAGFSDNDREVDGTEAKANGHGTSTQSSSIEIRPQSQLEHYTHAFFATEIREWPNIDQWRINKYLLLIRLSLRELFQICLRELIRPPSASKNLPRSSSSPSSTHTRPKGSSPARVRHRPVELPRENAPNTFSQAENLVRGIMHITTQLPLNPTDSKIPNGLKLHVLDVWVDELTRSVDVVCHEDKSVVDDEDDNNNASSTNSSRRSASTDSESNIKDVLRREFMEPIRHLADKGAARNVRLRAREVIKEFEQRAMTTKADADADTDS